MTSLFRYNIVRTPLFDAYWGDRTGVLVDGNGHLWSLASKVENLSQEEISNRAKPVDLCYEVPLMDAGFVTYEVVEAEVHEDIIAA